MTIMVMIYIAIICATSFNVLNIEISHHSKILYNGIVSF